MRQGSNQELSSEGVLNFLKFDEYIFNLAPFMNTYELVHYKISDRYMHELLHPDLQQEWEQRNRVKMIAEFHSRLSSPLYNLAFMAMALNAVIGGAFSRLGYGRRIAMIAGVVAFVRILGFAVQAACDDNAALNVVQYAVPLIATWWALAQVFRQKSSRSGGLRLLGSRKPEVEWIT